METILELRKYMEYDFATPKSVSNIPADAVQRYKNATDTFTVYRGEEYGFWKDREFRLVVVKRKKKYFNVYVSGAMFFHSVIHARLAEILDFIGVSSKIPEKLLKRYPTMYEVNSNLHKELPTLDYTLKFTPFSWIQKWEYSTYNDLPAEVFDKISDFVSFVSSFLDEWHAFKASRFYALFQEAKKRKEEAKKRKEEEMEDVSVLFGIFGLVRIALRCYNFGAGGDGGYLGGDVGADGLLSAGDFAGDINFDGISDSDISNFFNNDVNSPFDGAISNALTCSVDGTSLGEMLGVSYEPSFGGNLYDQKALDVLEELKDNNIPLPDSVNLSSDRSDYIVQGSPDGGFYSCEKILIKHNIDAALESGKITEQVAERLKNKVTGA